MAYADGDDTGTMADDGIATAAEGDREASAAGRDPVVRKLGFILDEDNETAIAKAVAKLREDQRILRSRRRARWQRNIWWREGKRGVRLVKKQDSALWEAKLPSGMGQAPPVPNKTDRLCRRVTNTILVDPPYPECAPGGDNNEDRDAAEFATRYLIEQGAPASLNIQQIMSSVMDKGHTFGSGFAWITMDPTARGWRPRTMEAHPLAQHQDDATTDPRSGLKADEQDLTKRFLRPDGYLTDDSKDADLQWMPGHKVRLLNGLQLDFLPAQCGGIHDATGVVIADATTLGDLKAQFPDKFEEMSDADLETLCKWRGKEIKDILPPDTPEPEDQKDEKTKKYTDAQMVVVLTVYYRSCAEYPMGCYAVIGGDSVVLHKQKWTAMMESPDGTEKEECLMLPIAQNRCLDDNIRDDPYGIGMSEHLGPADEVRNAALGFELEHMFRSANPIPFLPVGSIVQPKQFQLRDGNPVFTAPGGKPEWEAVPALSETVPLLREEMTTEMNDESGLQQAAQGVEGPDVNSGIHAQTIVQEALKAVINMKNNGEYFYIRFCQILLQQARAFLSVPDLLSYTGKDGEYKEKEFRRTDFRNTKRVGLAKGSYTMHTLVAKTEMANAALDRKVIDGDDYADMVAGGISPIIGTQDNPALLRIRRQLDKWNDGPDEQWLEQQQAFESAQQAQAAAAAAPPPMPAVPAPSADPSMATPAPQPAPMTPPVQVPVQAPVGPFSARVPVDLEPSAAKIRHRQMSRIMCSNRYTDFPEAWRAHFEKEYADMANAAGIMSVPQIQQAKAQEQAAAQKAAADELAFKRSMEQQKLDIEKQRLVTDLDKLALDKNQGNGKNTPYPLPPTPAPDGLPTAIAA